MFMNNWVFKVLALLVSVLLVSCVSTTNREQKEKWKKEIMQTEEDFCTMVAEDGIGKAFIYYAADSAVLMRSNRLIKGKDAIRATYENLKSEQIKLDWKPDFVEVSASGDFAYTYGKYVFEEVDSIGNVSTQKGIFHTVWMRQADGSWKFVWD